MLTALPDSAFLQQGTFRLGSTNELPVVNMATALALTLIGPGRFSLDRLFGIRFPRVLVIAGAIVEAVMVAIGIISRPIPAPAPPVEQQTTTPVEAGRGPGTASSYRTST